MSQRQIRTSFIIRFFSFILRFSPFILFFLSSLCWGQTSQTAWSLNSGGDAAFGGPYRLQTTLGQGGVIGWSQWGIGATYQIAWGFQTPEGSATEAPRIVAATVSDVNNNGVIQPGDELVLTLDRSVIVTTHVLEASHFFLPVAGDSLGKDNFAVKVNPHNSRQIRLILGGPTVHLTTAGNFSMLNRTPGSPSGIDFATSLPLGAIVSLDGIPAADGGQAGVDDSGIDIELSLVKRSAAIGNAGGSLSVGLSPDAAYTRHQMDFPAGALATTATFEMLPPPENLGVIDAVQVRVVSGDPGTTFPLPVTLYLQYREGDIDWERGQLESEMCVHQLVENPPGVLRYMPVPGRGWLENAAQMAPYRLTHKLDVRKGRVAVELRNFNPCRSVGASIVFAGLPIETVDERTINIKPSGSGMVKGDGVVVLEPGPLGAYTRHCIEFPNHIETVTTDPARLIVKIQTATLADRWSSSGGQSFPAQSGAIFLVTTTNADGQPVAFTAPVHVTVQFKDRPDPAETDVVLFDGRLGTAGNMRLMRDVQEGAAVDFQFIDAPSQIVDIASGTVTLRNFVGLTGADGRGVFGAVAATGGASTRTDHWELYR